MIDIDQETLKNLTYVWWSRRPHEQTQVLWNGFVERVGILCAKFRKPLFLFLSDTRTILPKRLEQYLSDDSTFIKPSDGYMSGIHAPDLVRALEKLQLEELHVCGAFAEMCVLETMKDFKDEGLAKRFIVHGDAVLVRSEERSRVQGILKEYETKGIEVVGDIFKANGFLDDEPQSPRQLPPSCP